MGTYRKENMTWQMFREFLLDVTDSNGVVDKAVVITAKKHKLYRWAKVSLIVKRGEKIFNGNSQVHINEIGKKYFDKYMNFKYPSHAGYKSIGQITLPKIGCKLTPPPHIIKDAMKGTVTVVPQGKEKEFIESTKVAQPQQRRQFILIIGWGLLTIKF
jgi:hypothetical protein